MNEGLSDTIIAISIVVGTFIGKYFFKKLKWGWQLLIILALSILISVLVHLIVNAFLN